MLSLCVTQSSCGFPDYSFNQAGSGEGGSSNGGSAGAVPAGGNPSGGADSAGAGTGTDAGSSGMGGDSGAGAAAGAGGEICVYPTPVLYPTHCFDQALDDLETGVDCGGGDCLPCDSNQTCLAGGDCASGSCTTAKTCAPVLSLQYTSIVADPLTRTPKFQLLITYLDSKQVMLSDLSIRYYFNHNSVYEPVIALDTQGTLELGSAQMNIAPSTHWTIHRFPLGPADQNNHKTDSYLEITFTSPVLLTNGAKIDLTQDIVAGSNQVTFDQNSHYSFMNAPSPMPNEAITVYRADAAGVPQRVWGVDPPMNVLPDCAYASGVNVGGGMLTVDGQMLQASAGLVQFAGTPYSGATPKPLPTPDDDATATMLSTAFPISDSVGAVWTVPQSGKYWVYAWATSAASADSGTLSLQDNPADKFVGTQQASSSYWSLMGPYPVIIADDLALRLTCAGTVNVAGLALYRMQP